MNCPHPTPDDKNRSHTLPPPPLFSSVQLPPSHTLAWIPPEHISLFPTTLRVAAAWENMTGIINSQWRFIKILRPSLSVLSIPERVAAGSKLTWWLTHLSNSSSSLPSSPSSFISSSSGLQLSPSFNPVREENVLSPINGATTKNEWHLKTAPKWKTTSYCNLWLERELGVFVSVSLSWGQLCVVFD